MHLYELEFDDENEDKLAAHGIYLWEVMQILENRFIVRKNKRNRAGSRQVIGRTRGGRILTIIVAPTPVNGRWRPITGWDSTAEERRFADG